MKSFRTVLGVCAIVGLAAGARAQAPAAAPAGLTGFRAEYVAEVESVGKKLEGVSRDSEKTVTDKAQIVALLQKAIANAAAAGSAVSDADLDKKVKTYGDLELTERQVLARILFHMHEHLGQSIAYARMNGVTPPWSKTD